MTKSKITQFEVARMLKGVNNPLSLERLTKELFTELAQSEREELKYRGERNLPLKDKTRALFKTLKQQAGKPSEWGTIRKELQREDRPRLISILKSEPFGLATYDFLGALLDSHDVFRSCFPRHVTKSFDEAQQVMNELWANMVRLLGEIDCDPITDENLKALFSRNGTPDRVAEAYLTKLTKALNKLPPVMPREMSILRDGQLVPHKIPQ